MMRRLFLALLMLCAGCSDDEITGDSTSTGAYTLRTVNGAPPPYTIASGSEAGTTIISDIITLYDGFTFAEVVQFRGPTGGAVQSKTLTGRWELFGNSITLRINETGTSRLAKGDGATMTFVESGTTSVYRK